MKSVTVAFVVEDGIMTHDSKIDNKTDFGNVFHFADPMQKLVVVDKYCGDYNGFMLYNLYDYTSGKCFRCWRTKLYWNLPRATHRENYTYKSSTTGITLAKIHDV